MRPSRHNPKRWRSWVAAAAWCGFVQVSLLPADSIWLDKPTGAPMFASARIVRIDQGMIYFLVGGRETSRELSRIARISLDDEPALNQAEEAFATAQWDAAVDAYEKVARSSAKPWVREWAAGRLVEASSKSGRFDSAVAAYIALVMKDPSGAVDGKPALPEAGSTYLDTAIGQVNQALANPRLSDPQKTSLLSFLIELHTARRDESAANAAAARLDDLLARDPTNPAAARASVRRKLQSVDKLLDARNYPQAVNEIETSAAIFTDAESQAEALFLMARARDGMAGQTGDRRQLQDAALAYMRVVAHFKDVPGRPKVAASLARVAEICEQLGDRESAIRVYEDLSGQFGDDPAVASAARASADRLRAQPK